MAQRAALADFVTNTQTSAEIQDCNVAMND